MKNNKGITLIALIITIIVMLILAAVTINMVVGEDGIIKQGERAAEVYKEEEKIENFKLESIFKLTGSGERFSEENIKDILETSDDTGIDPQKLTTYHDKYYKKDFVVYRYELTTEDERTKLEEKGIKRLLGDLNCDGVLDSKDCKKIDDYIEGNYENLNEIWQLEEISKISDEDEKKDKFEEIIIEIADIAPGSVDTEVDGVISSEPPTYESILTGNRPLYYSWGN